MIILVPASCLWAAEPARSKPKLPGPSLSVDRDIYDFGKVAEGVDVSCMFRITNRGTSLLKITEIKPSCGCTLAIMKKKIIPPGASEDLKVVMDTSMKQGLVNKEILIKSNDPSKPSLTIHVKASVADPHSGLSAADKAVKIFQGRCAACHVQLGEGKTGEDLYMADCAMCHGFRPVGLLMQDYKDTETRARLKRIIEEGSPTHRSMPGYLKEKGGPLSKEQIESLMEYLDWRAGVERGSQK